MGRPRIIGNEKTSIQITWDQKDRMSAHRKMKKPEPGHEPQPQRDFELFEEILQFFEKAHPIKNLKNKQ